MRNDYQSFYSDLLTERLEFHYPPFYRLVYVYLKHRDENTVNSAGLELGSRLREIFSDRVLGPDKPAVARVKTLNIRKIMLKLENGIDYSRVRQYLRGALEAMLRIRDMVLFKCITTLIHFSILFLVTFLKSYSPIGRNLMLR